MSIRVATGSHMPDLLPPAHDREAADDPPTEPFGTYRVLFQGVGTVSTFGAVYISTNGPQNVLGSAAIHDPWRSGRVCASAGAISGQRFPIEDEAGYLVHQGPRAV